MSARYASMIILLALPLLAQSRSSRPPRFEDYPASGIFKGSPSEPVLKSPDERLFRTVIRQGVRKGWGVADGLTG
jgi:hypothetical protein